MSVRLLNEQEAEFRRPIRVARQSAEKEAERQAESPQIKRWDEGREERNACKRERERENASIGGQFLVPLFG